MAPLDNWTSRTSETDCELMELTYGSDTFVAIGEKGIILTSPDGVTWSSRNS